MADPKVSVLMSVFNGERHLCAAIDSILKQTFQDFEFIIIDDGSTDHSPQILNSYEDPRIRLITNEKNIGLTRSLNKGIDLCRGEYIARMDGDDISLPERLKKQVEFMDHNRGVGISGTWKRSIGLKSNKKNKFPIRDSEIRCMLLFNNAFCHSSLIISARAIKRFKLNYNPSLKYSQDYDFVVRGTEYFSVANIPKVLIAYRFHAHQIAESNRAKQIKVADRVRTYQFQKLGINPTEKELKLIFNFVDLTLPSSHDLVEESAVFLKRLFLANEEKKIYDRAILKIYLGQLWFRLCNASTPLGLKGWGKYWDSSLSNFDNPGLRKTTKFFIKSVAGALNSNVNYQKNIKPL
jgi:glycosyltransferase involved in cell wall biosynthesis